MSLNNPIAGGPHYIIALHNALEKAPNAYAKPPLTGGTQISSRFADERLAILDAICIQSGWNRNQVINALVDRGLYELFQQVGDETINVIMGHVMDKIVPTFDTSVSMMRELALFNRFQVFPAPQCIRLGQSPESMDNTWITRSIDRDRRMIELQHESAGWVLPLHRSHIEKFHRDTVSDARDGFKHCILELNMKVIINEGRLMLIPIFSGDTPDR